MFPLMHPHNARSLLKCFNQMSDLITEQQPGHSAAPTSLHQSPPFLHAACNGPHADAKAPSRSPVPQLSAPGSDLRVSVRDKTPSLHQSK